MTLVYYCVCRPSPPPSPGQESVYLSLQSNLVTLQVLSASPLLQEFIPHLLHLSSRVQTPSSLQSHSRRTVVSRRRDSLVNRNQKQTRRGKMTPQRASLHLQDEFSSSVAFHFVCRDFHMTFVTTKRKLIVSIERIQVCAFRRKSHLRF